MKMDKSDVIYATENNVERIKQMLGLQSWDISFKYGSLDSGAKGECHPRVEYSQAIIVIDPEEMSDETEVLHVLTHELCHCLTATLQTYKFAVAHLLLDEKKAFDAVNEIYERAEEEIVCAFCRILERRKDG